jgi:uncharacterized protein (DUF58 family)
MAALTMTAAFSTGNNLLYLLYSSVLALLGLSWLAGRLNLRRVRVRAAFPEQVFQGTPFKIKLILSNGGRIPAFGLRVRRESIQRLGAGMEAEASIPFAFSFRGLNVAEGVDLESSFPFGLFKRRVPCLGIAGTALPVLREVRGPAEITADASLSGRPVPRKGRGDELYGVRDYDRSDDSRLINWKLSAKAGRPLVNEYCAPGESRVTVRIGALGSGEEAERRIREAGSAFRYYLDSGAEVRLTTCEGGVEYGKGLLHLDKALRFLASMGEGKSPRPSRTPPAPEEDIRDSPGLRRLLFLGMGTVLASFSLVDEIGPGIASALAPAVLLGWMLQEAGARRPPRILYEAATAAMLAFILLLDWRISGIAVANAHLLLYLVVNRALADIKPRELPQAFLILYLAFILVSGLSISLWYIAAFLLFAAFAGAWLMLAGGFEAGDWRRWAPAAGFWGLASLGLSTLLFALSPRLESLRHINPFTAMGIDKLNPRESAAVGFSDGVTLGFYGELKRSTARMMRVRPLAPMDTRLPEALYVRGPALDFFDGRRWTKGRVDFAYSRGGKRAPSSAGRAWVPRLRRQLVFPYGDSPLGPGFEFTIYPMNQSVLFTAGGLGSVELPEGAAWFDHTDTAYLASPYSEGIGYTVYPAPGGRGFGPFIQGYGDIVRQRFLQTPPDPGGRVAGLASAVTARASGPEAKARAVEAWLRRACRYSTYSSSQRKSLEDFLFRDRSGNCEYFATAGAVLLRHAGVPARLATGFLAQDFNEYGRFFDVRQGQAHAWVEALADGRWILVDPTPASLFSQTADAFYRRVERMVNALELRWYRHVVGYDRFVQRDALFRLTRSVSPAALQSGLSRCRLPLLASACVILLAWGLRRLRRRLSRKPRTAYEKALLLLDGAGLGREAHLTAREHALRVARARPDLCAAAGLAELHYLDLYRGRGLDPDERSRAEGLLTSLESSLRGPPGISRPNFVK